jgi:hypothetical protein
MRELKSSRGLCAAQLLGDDGPALRRSIELLDGTLRWLQVANSGGQRRRGGRSEKARSFATQQAKLSFPVLFATKDVAGVYNIIYRYLFDRRRDLAIPTSFLLDKEGMIVKVYQGADRSATTAGGCEVAPATAAERLQKALPFRRSALPGRFSATTLPMALPCSSTATWSRRRSRFSRSSPPSRTIRRYYNLGTLNLRRNDFKQARSILSRR